VNLAGKAGDTVVLTIYYHGKMTAESESNTFGGVSSSDGCLFSVGVGFHNNYVSATQHWLPCYDHPSDKATFRFRFAVKPGMFVASNGIGPDISSNQENNIYEWYSNLPTATYMYTFAVDSLKAVDFSLKNHPIVVYTRENDVKATEFSFSLLPKMVSVLEELFGNYPFEKVGYVNTPLTTGAMEHQTMVTFPVDVAKAYYANKDSNNTMAVHELAHQWFGDAVSVTDFRDAWMSEGFATFTEALWEEKYKNYEKYLENIYTDIYFYINQTSANEGVFPLYDFPRENPSSNYPRTIYNKGAAVIALLRFELGDRFFPIIQSYIKDYKYSNITTKEFQQYLESKYGKKLDWFFNQWIYGKGLPKINVSVNGFKDKKNNRNSASITIEQVQQKEYGTYTNLPIPIRFYTYSGQEEYFIVKMTGQKETFTFDSLKYPVEMVDINCRNKLKDFVTLMEVASLTVDVNENGLKSEDEVDLTITPNPAEENINIKIIGNIGMTTLRIFNLTGDTIINTELNPVEENQDFSINSSTLSHGLYFVELRSGTNRTVMKSFIIK